MRTSYVARALAVCALAAGVRSEYPGGAALRVPGDESCPSGSEGNDQFTYQESCCPADQVFFHNLWTFPVCCPSSNSNCYIDVVTHIQCADPEWTLCAPGFCCQKDYVCFTQQPVGTTPGGLGCSPPAATLTSGQARLLTIYAAGAGPGASGFTSSTRSVPASTSAPADHASSRTTTSPRSKPTTSSPRETQTPTPTVSPAPAEPEESVSGGVIAGAAIGGFSVLAAALLLLVWIVRRTRRNKLQNQTFYSSSDHDKVVTDPNELKTYPVSPGASPFVLSELPGGHGISEAYGKPDETTNVRECSVAGSNGS